MSRIITRLVVLVLSAFGMLLNSAPAPCRGQDTLTRDVAMTTHGRFPQSVLLKLPNDYDPKKTYPLIVGLHGYGGTMAGLTSAFDGLRDQPVLLAFLQGEYRREGGGWSWYVMTEDRTVWEKVDELAVARVVEAIQEIKSVYSVGKISVFGFSQGASMAYLVGLLHPALISGIAAVSGSLPEIDMQGSILHAANIAEAKNVRIFVGRGFADKAVPREEYSRQVDFLSKAGFDVSTYEFQGGHTLTGMLMARMWRWVKKGTA